MDYAEQAAATARRAHGTVCTHYLPRRARPELLTGGWTTRGGRRGDHAGTTISRCLLERVSAVSTSWWGTMGAPKAPA
jgi:hypothetical protein